MDGQSPSRSRRSSESAKTPRPAGARIYGWQARKDQIRSKTQKKVDQKLIDRSARIVAQLDDLQQQIAEEMGRTRFMSKEGAIGAF